MQNCLLSIMRGKGIIYKSCVRRTYSQFDGKLVKDIGESSYLQYFLGYEGDKYKTLLNPNMMIHFGKRISRYFERSKCIDHREG